MERPFTVLLIFCLLAGILFTAGCTTSKTTGKVVSGTAAAATTVTVSPLATSDIAQPIRAMPADLPKIDVPAGSIAKYYVYTLDGSEGVIGLALPTSVYDKLVAEGHQTMQKDEGYVGFFQHFMNEPTQQPYIQALADEIRKKTSNPDDQVRIAVSLVQHIPYHHGEYQRYPYRVLYEGTGICGEKSMLLALLLKDLGYGSCAFYFKTEGHMTAGIKAAAPYDYKGTGYAFIETTEPKIITFDQSYFPEFKGVVSSTPIVIPEGSGKDYAGVAEDYQDAREWERIGQDLKNKTLSAADKAQRTILDKKYDLSYFTCQNCNLPTVA